MCSWALESTRDRVLAAIVGEDRVEAARILVEETSPEYAAALIAELRVDVEKAGGEHG